MVSPRLADHLFGISGDDIQVATQPQSCQLIRRGNYRENTIQCNVSYDYQGQSYTSKTIVWSSESPLDSLSSLEQELNQQSAIIHRSARIHSYSPKYVEILDERLLTMPPMWMCMAAFLAAFLMLIIGYGKLIPTAHRRADMDYDSNGNLVEVNSSRIQTMKKFQKVLLCVFAGLVVIGCLYDLTNRPGNAVSMMRLHDLQPVPATLTNCTHHYHGSTKGHDQIECDFRYAWNGQTYIGAAEAIDFRNFPTDDRLAAAAKAAEGKSVTAYVATNRPSYAWSFISNAWLVTYSWGLSEWMILLLFLPAALIALSPTKSIRLKWWNHYATSTYRRTVILNGNRFEQGGHDNEG